MNDWIGACCPVCGDKGPWGDDLCSACEEEMYRLARDAAEDRMKADWEGKSIKCQKRLKENSERRPRGKA